MLRSISTVSSVEPVSSTTTQSASRMDSIQRRANLASFLQIAYTHTFQLPIAAHLTAAYAEKVARVPVQARVTGSQTSNTAFCGSGTM